MPAPIENTEDWTPEDQRQKISELDDNVVDVHGVRYIHDVVVEITGTAGCAKPSYVRKTASFMLSQVSWSEKVRGQDDVLLRS
ncbi:uncharacterized protein DC041_0001590 [Schistosoma bovis]|uniref:Uncharacterized protein n=1 Tax=Schistosoma bovis TaxID=6184 RepID=A0A430PXE4_SCHBO|nr:uncharacterized protein DC041_0001590 [Schistosoma bovis]